MPDTISDVLLHPRTMIEALRQNPTPRRFFAKTFFSRTRTHATKSVDIDIQKTKRRMAGYANPIASAKVVEREGFVTKTVTPAYLKEKVPLRIPDLMVRKTGETVYDPVSPAERAAAIIGEDLRMLEERFVRREEYMCAEALLTGKIAIVGEGVNDVVDFDYIPGEHVITLSGTSCWNAADGDPQKDLDDWRIMINKRSGLLPNTAIVGAGVYWAIINNAKVAERLDNRRIELGVIRPADLPEGIRYLGTLQPSMLDIFAYDEWYTDPADGADKPIVPDDVVLLGSAQARCEMHYGLIQNLKNPVAVSRFPSSWIEEDGSAQWLQLESAPLPNLYQADGFLVAHVLQ